MTVHFLRASALLLGLAAAGAQAQTSPIVPSKPVAAAEWKYQTPRLKAAEVDALLAQPERLLVLDIRRPDELIKYGSFPAFLNIQYSQLEQQLGYLPKDRLILAVSNRAQRAGRIGDLLAAKGYQVVGATGSADYEEEGGKAVSHVLAPPPRAAASSASP